MEIPSAPKTLLADLRRVGLGRSASSDMVAGGADCVALTASGRPRLPFPHQEPIQSPTEDVLDMTEALSSKTSSDSATER